MLRHTVAFGEGWKNASRIGKNMPCCIFLTIEWRDLPNFPELAQQLQNFIYINIFDETFFGGDYASGQFFFAVL